MAVQYHDEGRGRGAADPGAISMRAQGGNRMHTQESVAAVKQFTRWDLRAVITLRGQMLADRGIN